MNELEMEFAAAIQAAHSEWWNGSRTVALAGHLAPLMVAAIEAALHKGEAVHYDRAWDAALAAWRRRPA